MRLKSFINNLRRELAKEYRYYFRPADYPLRKSKNGDFIFIHINKTAGTSLAKVIGLPHKRHLPVNRLINMIGETSFNRAYKFCVVRNPWDRAISHYKYLARKNYYNVNPEKVSFKEWLKATYGETKNPYYYYNPIMFDDQLSWISDKDGNIRVDTILRFENLQSDFVEVAQRIGVSPELPRLNKTESVHYSKYYDEESIRIVEMHSKKDIEAFGYSFEYK